MSIKLIEEARKELVEELRSEIREIIRDEVIKILGSDESTEDEDNSIDETSTDEVDPMASETDGSEEAKKCDKGTTVEESTDTDLNTIAKKIAEMIVVSYVDIYKDFYDSEFELSDDFEKSFLEVLVDADVFENEINNIVDVSKDEDKDSLVDLFSRNFNNEKVPDFIRDKDQKNLAAAIYDALKKVEVEESVDNTELGKMKIVYIKTNLNSNKSGRVFIFSDSESDKIKEILKRSKDFHIKNIVSTMIPSEKYSKQLFVRINSFAPVSLYAANGHMRIGAGGELVSKRLVENLFNVVDDKANSEKASEFIDALDDYITKDND